MNVGVNLINFKSRCSCGRYGRSQLLLVLKRKEKTQPTTAGSTPNHSNNKLFQNSNQIKLNQIPEGPHLLSDCAEGWFKGVLEMLVWYIHKNVSRWHGAVFYSGQSDSCTCSVYEPPLLSFSQLLLSLLLFACWGGGRDLITWGRRLRHRVKNNSYLSVAQYRFLVPSNPPQKVDSCLGLVNNVETPQW